MADAEAPATDEPTPADDGDEPMKAAKDDDDGEEEERAMQVLLDKVGIMIAISVLVRPGYSLSEHRSSTRTIKIPLSPCTTRSSHPPICGYDRGEFVDVSLESLFLVHA